MRVLFLLFACIYIDVAATWILLTLPIDMETCAVFTVIPSNVLLFNCFIFLLHWSHYFPPFFSLSFCLWSWLFNALLTKMPFYEWHCNSWKHQRKILFTKWFLDWNVMIEKTDRSANLNRGVCFSLAISSSNVNRLARWEYEVAVCVKRTSFNDFYWEIWLKFKDSFDWSHSTKTDTVEEAKNHII